MKRSEFIQKAVHQMLRHGHNGSVAMAINLANDLEARGVGFDDETSLKVLGVLAKILHTHVQPDTHKAIMEDLKCHLVALELI